MLCSSGEAPNSVKNTSAWDLLTIFSNFQRLAGDDAGFLKSFRITNEKGDARRVVDEGEIDIVLIWVGSRFHICF